MMYMVNNSFTNIIAEYFYFCSRLLSNKYIR